MVLISLGLSGCLSVREQDVMSWVDRPVSDLELHPVFNTIPVVKTKTSDGTEIWNYVNVVTTGNCFGNLSSVGSYQTYETYTAFSNCISRKGACNNMFYVKNGRVLKYVPVGSGGVRCYTDETLQPGFSGATNFN